jgi:hypothetical protein
MRNEPLFTPIGGDPRFAALLERLEHSRPAGDS